MDSIGLISALLFGEGSSKITFGMATMSTASTQITLPKAKCLIILPSGYSFAIGVNSYQSSPIILVPGMSVSVIYIENLNIGQDCPKVELDTSGTILRNVSNWSGFTVSYAHIPA